MNQKILKFNRSNFFTGLILLLLLNIIGPGFVDPTKDIGQVFYFSMAIVTVFLFPFFTVEEVSDENQDQTPKS